MFVVGVADGCRQSGAPSPKLEGAKTMLAELTRVFACLAAGELLSRSGVMPFPGPVIGLVVLYANLMVLRFVPEKLGALADTVLSFLGMLFVPAGVGVIAYFGLLQKELAPILAGVLAGTMVTLCVTALAANRLTRGCARTEPEAAHDPV